MVHKRFGKRLKSLNHRKIQLGNRPVIRTCFTYPILNMDDFSALYGPLGYKERTHKVTGNSLHAQRGIGKEGKMVIIHATFINQSFSLASSIAALTLHLAFSLWESFSHHFSSKCMFVLFLASYNLDKIRTFLSI